YLTYPFVASWSLREELAAGCPVIGSDTQPVREFITHGDNGLLTSFFDPRGLASTIQDVLEDTALNRRLRAGARRYAEQHLSMRDYLAAYTALITRLTGKPLDEGRDEPVRERNVVSLAARPRGPSSRRPPSADAVAAGRVRTAKRA